MLTVTKLAHVGFRPQDLSTQAEFYNDRWGLEAIDEHAGEMFFRADSPDHHVLTLHTADAPGLHHFAFEVASAQDLDRATDELAALGLNIVTSPTADLEPGVARAMRFCDPEGNLVELIAGVDTVRDLYAKRDVEPVGLNQWQSDAPAQKLRAPRNNSFGCRANRVRHQGDDAPLRRRRGSWLEHTGPISGFRRRPC